MTSCGPHFGWILVVWICVCFFTAEIGVIGKTAPCSIQDTKCSFTYSVDVHLFIDVSGAGPYLYHLIIKFATFEVV